MVEESLFIIAAGLRSCVIWFEDLISAIGGAGIIIAALLTVFAIGIILEPLRGSMDMHLSHYSKNRTHSSKSNKSSKKSKKGG